MEHQARLSSHRIIAIGFVCLGMVVLLSLIINIIQAVNNYRLQSEQKVVVTPMLYNQPFAVALNTSDTAYLQQMALSFIALRLNVSPETVEAAHAILLKFVKPAAQTQLKVQLAMEAKRIKDSNVNAAFYQSTIRVYPNEQRVDIQGELKTWIGDGKPLSEIKHYVLFLERLDGLTRLVRFLEVNHEKASV